MDVRYSFTPAAARRAAFNRPPLPDVVCEHLVFTAIPHDLEQIRECGWIARCSGLTVRSPNRIRDSTAAVFTNVSTIHICPVRIGHLPSAAGLLAAPLRSSCGSGVVRVSTRALPEPAVAGSGNARGSQDRWACRATVTSRRGEPGMAPSRISRATGAPDAERPGHGSHHEGRSIPAKGDPQYPNLAEGADFTNVNT